MRKYLPYLIGAALVTLATWLVVSFASSLVGGPLISLPRLILWAAFAVVAVFVYRNNRKVIHLPGGPK